MASPAITPGVYPLAITMVYTDDTGNTQTITSDVGIQVSGGTNFEIIMQQSSTTGTTFAVANTGANTASSVIVSIPKQASYASSGASSVSLGNLDAGDYTLATFQLTSMNLNTTSTGDTTPTGRPGFNLDTSEMPSDFDPSMFEQMRNQSFMGAAGSNLIIEVSYTDLYGIRQTVENEVEVTSMSSSGSTSMTSRFSGMTSMPGEVDSGLSSGTTYIIIGVVGILLIVALLQIGKRKKIPYLSKIVKGQKDENS